MTGLELCQWVRDTSQHGAERVHVGAACHRRTDPRLARFRRIGLTLMLATGALLFWGQPVHCYQSIGFRIKMLLLLIAISLPQHSYVKWPLWAAIIAAARGIAYF